MNSQYLKEVVKEVKLSSFPSQETVINFTIFVIALTAVVAVYLGVLDLVFGKGTVGFIEVLKSSEYVSGLSPEVSISTTTATSTATTTATGTDILIK